MGAMTSTTSAKSGRCAICNTALYAALTPEQRTGRCTGCLMRPGAAALARDKRMLRELVAQAEAGAKLARDTARLRRKAGLRDDDIGMDDG